MVARAAAWSLVVALLWGGATAAFGAEAERHCLSREHRRAVAASGHVVALSKAIRAARAGRGGEVVDARLCREPRGYVYMLTLLPRDGKVIRATVDAASGKLIGIR